ncbi:MAG TPA: tetratricopeptide repeat protein [Terriglobales bacterium]|nr:tetratricopeptide repeat protein [Terriglobales bacterium]
MRTYSRHELKQDRFAEAVTERMSWALAHRQKLMVAGIAVSVLLVAAVGGWFYLQHRDVQASLELGKAVRTYQTPLRPPNAPASEGPSFASAKERAQAANKAFRDIQQNYRFTKSAEIAHYFAAVTAMDLGDLPTAEKELKDIAGSRNQDLAPLAKFALASVYRQMNKDAEAIKIYQELISNPSRTVPKATAQLELASMYAAKQPAEAKRIYQQIRQDEPNGPAAQIADARLAGLKP